MKIYILQNRILTIFIFFFITVSSYKIAQGGTNDVASAYIFSQSITQYTPVQNGIVLASDPGHGSYSYGPLSIGFNFNYCGIDYNKIVVSDNGWVVLSSIWIPPYDTHIICNGPFSNVICPFNGNLFGYYDTLRYLTMGTAPYRVLTVEWFQYGFYSTGYNEINFQLKLFETTNIIQFVYQPTNPQDVATDLQIGLIGATHADFATRTTISDWTSTTPGTVCSEMFFIPPNTIPPNGLTYTYTPPSACTISTYPYGYGFGTTGLLDQCWTFEQLIGYNNWTIVASSSHPVISPYCGPYMALFPAYDNNQARIKSPSLNFSSFPYPELSFFMSRDSLNSTHHDSLVVEVTTNNGSTWNYSASFQRYSPYSTPYWEQKLVDLSPYSGNNNVRIGIKGVGQNGDNICVDTILIKQIETVPVVTTTSAAATGSSTAKCGGLVTSNSPLLAHGICWNTSGNPSIADPHTSDGTNTPWTSYINGLNANQMYHVRAYATNSIGTAYGNDLTFTTCSVLSLPYSEGFAGISSAGSWPCGWSSQTSNYVTTGLGSGCLTQNSASFTYSSSSKWVFSPGLNLLGGNQYAFSVLYKTDGLPGWLKFQAKYGIRPDSTTMSTITGAIVNNPINTNCVQMTGTFTPASNGIYYIGLNCIDNGVPWYFTFDDILLTGPNGVIKNDNQIPKSFRLYQNYPNPFNPSTKIKLDVPEVSGQSATGGSEVRLVIYDILGREAEVIINEKLSPGSYEFEFDGTGFSSGLYFYQLIADGNIINTKKMLLMK